MFGKIKKIHLVGIGGIGMCGIAELLIDWDFQISGSDIQVSANTDRLTKLGAKITIGHSKKNVVDCDALIYSSAIESDNPEIIAASKKKIPIIRRAEMLGEMIKLKPISIAVGGTHGKTTTTLMVGYIFSEGKRDPVIIAGGIDKSIKSTVKPGNGDIIIVEADEFDRSFLELSPTQTIITTVEAEHLDCYSSLEDIENTFIQFANSIPFYGTITACIDEPGIRKILPELDKKVNTYGISPDADIYAEDINLQGYNSYFKVKSHGKDIGQVHLSVPGIHNIKNALAAITLGLEFDIPFKTIASSLSKFRGVKRRFEIISETDNYMLVDDYAHHPTEIKATLRAAKDGWNRRIIAIFQPHLFTRTRDFYNEFGEALQEADVIIVLDVFPAREKPIKGISGKLIANAARKLGHREVYYGDRDTLPTLIKKHTKPGDMIFTLGAGDIWKVHKKIKEILVKIYSPPQSGLYVAEIVPTGSP